MRKHFFIGILFLTGIVSSSFGQAVSFLNAFLDARTVAMDNAGYALPSPFAAHRNIASMMSAEAPPITLAASYLIWQPQYANAALVNTGGYVRFKNFGLAAGFRHNSMQAVEKIDAQSNVTGTFVPSEYAAEAGMACKINGNFSAGAAFRYITSDIGGAKKSSALAADISLYYSRKNLSAGLGVSNFGSKIGYGSSEYGLPKRITAGGAYLYSPAEKHVLKGVFDVACQSVSGYAGVAGGVGAEYTCNRLVSARAGYHFESNNVGASYVTLGCGIHFAGFSIDFAYLVAGNNNPMRQTMIFSLGVIKK
ncbi:MAG: PorV/PorQ family protein [Dysgonamonadaceae bacterium]|jgi:hypothetical protein|nr:PorV/PorQ family protein [Dysgonamonadaceae bacterium]